MKRLLLHVCCGPCSTYPLQLLGEQFEVTAFFYGPNIHPEEEYKKRLESFIKFCQKYHFNFQEGLYQPDDYFEKIKGQEKNKAARCPICYELRLEETAKQAAKDDYDYFSTTLLISPHQDIDKIRELGHSLAANNDILFYDAHPEESMKKYKGFRPGFALSRRMAKKEGLYLQEYCGCLFSRDEV